MTRAPGNNAAAARHAASRSASPTMPRGLRASLARSATSFKAGNARPGRIGYLSRELDLMAGETRIERRLDRQLGRIMTPRGAAIVIALVTTSITAAAGLLMTVVDRDGFPSLGSGLWWAVQTVTTVGYGDHVPATAGGQITAAVVMLIGIGFVTVITASITSSFVERSRREQQVAEGGVPSTEQFRKIEERLERIEAALSKR